MKRIFVLGGDGFCGWPTALHLSAKGYDVTIIDNLSRRRIADELGAASLTPIATIDDRLSAWREQTGKTITFINLDIAREYDRLLEQITGQHPSAIVHFAEQRAAPYSMKSSRHKRYTVENNVTASHNLLAAIVDSGLDIHLVHLGTMGVYGYSNAGMRLPEGYLNVKMGAAGRETEQEILYPANPGSIYHMTKTLDQQLFAFYARNDNVRITDLHQGIVWGTQTPETALDPRLINRFDYDGDYGTVLNRFLMQAAVDYPLTVHGTGGQTRAFIHIRDTVQCVEIAIRDEPARGDRVRIFNQMTEIHRIRDLAAMVAGMTGARIAHVHNPRNEADENDLQAENDHLLNRGLSPVKLSAGLMAEITDIARVYAHNADLAKIPCLSFWNEARAQGGPHG